MSRDALKESIPTPADTREAAGDATEPSLAGEVSRAIPGFAGVHFAAEGELVISVIDARDFEPALAAVKKRMTSHRTAGGVVTAETVVAIPRIVAFSFAELARARSVLRQHLLALEGVVGLDVNERRNSVVVSTATTGSQAAARGLSRSLGVNPDLVTFVLVSGELRDFFQPTLSGVMGPSHGGWRIWHPNGGCTLGYAARRVSDAMPVFVTNSHCTPVLAGLDGSTVTQSGDTIGYEIVDPQPHQCGAFNPGPCRNSDAALFAATAPIRLGRIGKTTQRSATSFGLPTIDVFQPTLTITAKSGYVIENEILDKIGASTGWTYGPVEDVCADWKTSGLTKQCSDRVDLGGIEGDSGAPVFSLLSNGTVELRGIIWGGAPWPWSDALFSNIGRIESDLGGLTVFDNGAPSIQITGPSTAPPGSVCEWTAVVSGGVPPYSSPGWSGLYSGQYATISAVADTSGWLFYEVTDHLGRSNVASHYVSVVGVPGPIICP